MRSIIIFPEMYNLDEIQKVRNTYDPLAKNISPHISLVFPFESKTSDELLIKQIKPIIQTIKSFAITFDKFGHDDKGYFWLQPAYGTDKLTKLHDELYKNELLHPFLRADIPYMPHITLGKVNPAQQDKIISNLVIRKLSFSTFIDTVSIEHILPNNDSDEFEKILLP